MMIEEYFSSLKNLSCHCYKSLLHYIGTSRCIAHAHYYITEARSVKRIWEARAVYIAEAHGVRRFPPSSPNCIYSTCIKNTDKKA